MNFSEAMFYENYLTSDFHTNTVISRRVCLLVKMASKAVIRPMATGVMDRKQPSPKGSWAEIVRTKRTIIMLGRWQNQWLMVILRGL